MNPRPTGAKLYRRAAASRHRKPHYLANKQLSRPRQNKLNAFRKTFSHRKMLTRKNLYRFSLDFHKNLFSAYINKNRKSKKTYK